MRFPTWQRSSHVPPAAGARDRARHAPLEILYRKSAEWHVRSPDRAGIQKSGYAGSAGPACLEADRAVRLRLGSTSNLSVDMFWVRYQPKTIGRTCKALPVRFIVPAFYRMRFPQKTCAESFPPARVLAKGIQHLPGDRSEFAWIN